MGSISVSLSIILASSKEIHVLTTFIDDLFIPYVNFLKTLLNYFELTLQILLNR